MIRTYFDQQEIKDLNNSLQKEFLQTANDGAYCASTISGCNTRKYHGLLVAPQSQIDEDNHVFLSAIEEVINYKGEEHNLGMHQYPGVYHPDGYQHIIEFFGNPIPKWMFGIGDAILTKELLLSANDDTVFIRYTLAEADDVMKINFRPFLAFRNVHQLSKANMHVSKKVKSITNGIRIRLYPSYSELHLQTSQNAEFITAPDWYYNIEYNEERNRGYDYQEDLYIPGHFVLEMKKGDQVVFAASLKENHPKTFKARFSTLLKKKPVLNNLGECLSNAGQEFIIKTSKKWGVKAGYYWFNTWGRDAFISLPGLTLCNDHPKMFKTVIDGMLPDLKNGLFPNIGTGKTAVYNSVDASLWFVWAIQQYAEHTTKHEIWKQYGKYLKHILDNYKKGTLHHIKMDKDGLIYAGEQGFALTWMDGIVENKAVTPRIGKPVEINALWYNAICFCLDIAKTAADDEFVTEWQEYPELIARSFMDSFWDENKGYLADCVTDNDKDWSIRPNQVFAISLPYSPIPAAARASIIDIIKEELLTPRGLRTLSPGDPNYKGTYGGDQKTRDKAYHKGTVWPWLLGHFAEAYLKHYNSDGLLFVQDLYEQFKPAVEEKCLYSISEVYNGDEPHHAGGAVSQAWSVAELLRIRHLIIEHKKHTSAYQKEQIEE